MTKSKRNRLRVQREGEKCAIHDFCDEEEISMDEITPYQIRLNGVVDVYPTRKRYCVLDRNGGMWGTYRDIKQLKGYLK